MNEHTKNLIKKQLAVILLITANLLVFLFLSFSGDTENAVFMFEHGAMYYPAVLDGQFWRIFTAMFLHFGIRHLLSNMLSLYAIGSIIEAAFGKPRFLLLYFGSGIIAGLTSTFWHAFRESAAVCAGASGAIFGLSGAMVCMALFKQTERYGVNSRRVPMAVLISVIISSTGSTDIAAHIGGLAAGFLIALIIINKFRKKAS